MAIDEAKLTKEQRTRLAEAYAILLRMRERIEAEKNRRVKWPPRRKL